MLCARITYLGELGYELYVPAEDGLKVYDALQATGAAYDLKPVGLKALASLRMEKGYRDFGHDIDNTDCPLEVGLGFALALDKPGGFRGREAVLARKAANAAAGGMGQRLVQVRVLDPDAAAVPRRGRAPRRGAGRLRPGGVVRLDARVGRRPGVRVGCRPAGDRRVAGGGHVDGRRRRHPAPDRGVAAADVRPHVRADPRLTGVDVLRLSPGGRELSELTAGLLPAAGGRLLLGITGSPGAGKSTLAAFLAETCGAVVVPMDGFHLADVELARRGLLDRKGAPETFDGWGYAALLARVRGLGVRSARARARARQKS